METRVKRATVIPPKQYKRRFRDALHRYFMASIEKYATDDGRIEELPPAALVQRDVPASSAGLPDLCPEGTSAYKLLVR